LGHPTLPEHYDLLHSRCVRTRIEETSEHKRIEVILTAKGAATKAVAAASGTKVRRVDHEKRRERPQKTDAVDQCRPRSAADVPIVEPDKRRSSGLPADTGDAVEPVSPGKGRRGCWDHAGGADVAQKGDLVRPTVTPTAPTSDLISWRCSKQRVAAGGHHSRHQSGAREPAHPRPVSAQAPGSLPNRCPSRSVSPPKAPDEVALGRGAGGLSHSPRNPSLAGAFVADPAFVGEVFEVSRTSGAPHMLSPAVAPTGAVALLAPVAVTQVASAADKAAGWATGGDYQAPPAPRRDREASKEPTSRDPSRCPLGVPYAAGHSSNAKIKRRIRTTSNAPVSPRTAANYTPWGKSPKRRGESHKASSRKNSPHRVLPRPPKPPDATTSESPRLRTTRG